MAGNRRTCARLKLNFEKAQPAQPILDRLLHRGLESAILLRGRMTDHDAWYEVEIAGPRRAVDEAVRGYRCAQLTA